VQAALACPDRGAVEWSAPTVGAIARAHGAALRASCALNWEQLAVLRDLERCRTAALGGHRYVCDTCGYTKPMYNSCRNRHCPTCQSIEQRRWLERRQETILPVPYFHLVFTLPSELRPVVAFNRERMFGLLFEAASRTLLLLSRDERHLGATPAVTMVLHTWTRELMFHPHVHAVVSAGGLGTDGQWVASRKAYLFPVKVMAALFRRLFREALLAAIEQGEVQVAAAHERAMRKALFETKWNVYAKAPFGGAAQVFGYLGRYTHRVGISNSRLLYADQHRVTFATKEGRSCTVTPVKFLRRLLLHVLPKRFHKIRHYGLCSSHHVAAGTIDLLREQLGGTLASAERARAELRSVEPALARADATPESWVECMLALTGLDVLRCPRCKEGRLMALPLELEQSSATEDSS